MDKFYRKICLEDFRNRMFNTESGETEWGTIAHDYIISESKMLELSDKLPLVSEYSGATTAQTQWRYGNILLFQAWFKGVLEESTFYYVCKRNDNKVWIKGDAPDFVHAVSNTLRNIKDICTELPDISTYDIGKCIWLTWQADEIKDKLKIPITGATETQRKNGLLRLQKVLKFYDNLEEYTTAVTTGIPYMDIDIMLTSDCYNMGNFTKYPTTATTTAITGVSDVSFIGESKVKTLMRRKKSYDDDGNELPFFFDGTTLGFLYLTDVPYNIDMAGQKITCDYVETLEKSVDTVHFIYYIGAEMDSNGNIKDKTGIKYEERYPIDNNKSLTFKYDGILTSVTYTDILYEEQNDDVVKSLDGLNVENQEWEDFKKEHFEAGKQYSKISYKTTGITDSSQLFMNDVLFGITDIKQEGSPRIERGTSAAFELHNILGECRSMDDLENYRNHFLTIKDDEKQ